MSHFPALPPEAVYWDKAVIDKYDSRGPRYTSYPTALEFNHLFDVKAHTQVLGDLQKQPYESLSIYIHIPFCQDICYYCACNKIVTRSQDAADEYLNYLEKEILLVSKAMGRSRKVTQLHLGGGTPTFLSSGQLTRLIHMLAQHFTMVDDNHREYSIEIDPRTVNTSDLALLKGLGFNRLSLGVQDFSPKVQKAINRINDVTLVRNLTLAARDLAYESINFDLIYGLPEQTPASLKETLQQVIELNPDRIAFYNYAHMPDRFSSQRSIDRMTLPTADQKIDMLNGLSVQLCEAGYRYIGMDHFVKPKDKLAIAQQHGRLMRNFQGYSVNKSQDLIGLGVSSISSFQQAFAQNEKDLPAYYAALDNGRLPTSKGLFKTADDERREFVIMALICNLQLKFDVWESRFKDNFHAYFETELLALKALEQDELITIAKDAIQVTSKGRCLLRTICMTFDAYHNNNLQLHSKVI